MRLLILVLILLSSVLISKAQLKMDVLNMTVSNLKKDAFAKKEYIQGKDTIVLAVCNEHSRNIPFVEVDLVIKNISDSVMTLQPNKNISKMYISFKLAGERYQHEVYFFLKDEKIYSSKDIIILEPNQSINLFSSTYIALQGTLLDVTFLEMEDRTLPIMEILPTLKFEYHDVKGLVVLHDSVLNVNIQDHPISLEQQFSEFDLDELFEKKKD